MTNRTLKTGDSFPPHVRVLEDDDGPIDLPGGATVRILARNAATLISDTCTIMTIQAALDTGYLRGTWAQQDLSKRAAVLWNIEPTDTALAGAGDIARNLSTPRRVADVDGVEFPESAKAINDYPIVALKDAPDTAGAAAFVAYVRSAPAQQVLADAGFQR